MKKSHLNNKKEVLQSKKAAVHNDENTFQFKDNRPENSAQRKIQEVANESATIIQPKTNNTGLPNQLKSGIETLSGFSMDDVKVHYNSPKPAQLQAHAYAQGTDIHIASGQEKHLPHEAWHVAQQKQGRVKPTMQMKGNVKINDDIGLEKEADVMGGKALQMRTNASFISKNWKKITNSTTQLTTKNNKRLNKHINDTDEILKLEIRKKGEKKTKKKKATKQQRTEALGEKGTALAIRKKFPSAVMLSGFESGVGIDQVWRVNDKILVVEAKGPGAKLGFADGIGNGAKQMSLEWVKSRAQFETKAVKLAIMSAIKNKKMKRFVGYGHKNGKNARLDDISNDA